MTTITRCNECRHCDYVQIVGQFGIYKACTNPHVFQAGGKPLGVVIDGERCDLYSRGSPQKSGRAVA